MLIKRKKTGARTRNWRARDRAEAITAYMFIAPDVIGLAIFVILPIFFALYISLFQWDLINDKIFIGLQNYARMAIDSEWWASIRRTLKLTLIYVPSLFCISLFFAVMVSYIRSKVAGFIKTSLLMPYAITSVIASTLWMFLYNEKRGYLNSILNLFGIPDQGFLGSQAQALPSIIVVLLWINIGYNMVLFLASIKDIPTSYYEAATLDGANRWQDFWYITFPLIKQTSAFILIVTTIASFQVMDIIMVMTRGGPAKVTEVAALYIYDRSFNMMEMGYGATLSVTLFLILLILSFVQFKLISRE